MERKLKLVPRMEENAAEMTLGLSTPHYRCYDRFSPSRLAKLNRDIRFLHLIHWSHPWLFRAAYHYASECQ